MNWQYCLICFKMKPIWQLNLEIIGHEHQGLLVKISDKALFMTNHLYISK